MVLAVVVYGAGDVDVGRSGLLDTIDKWLLECLLLLLLLILIQILFLSANLVIRSFSWLWHDNSSAGCGAILLLNHGNLNPI